MLSSSISGIAATGPDVLRRKAVSGMDRQPRATRRAPPRHEERPGGALVRGVRVPARMQLDRVGTKSRERVTLSRSGSMKRLVRMPGAAEALESVRMRALARARGRDRLPW